MQKLIRLHDQWDNYLILHNFISKASPCSYVYSYLKAYKILTSSYDPNIFILETLSITQFY